MLKQCVILAVTFALRAQKPELVVQTGHTTRVDSVASSPDGRTLAMGSLDNTVKLWDLATGRELRTLRSRSKPSDASWFISPGTVSQFMTRTPIPRKKPEHST
jgi:WD40 repeat protein